MIPDDKELMPGMIVRHDEGLLYKIEDTRVSTDHYELMHQLGHTVVNYAQLQEGSFPVGTKWSKDEAGFREHFTIEDQLRTVTLRDFCRLLPSFQGANQSWRGLVSVASQNADFPLQSVDEERRELSGDIAIALEWLEARIPSAAPPVYYRTLQKIHDCALDQDK